METETHKRPGPRPGSRKYPTTTGAKIMELIGKEKGNSEIARLLGVTPSAVAYYRRMMREAMTPRKRGEK